jgi:hypothetical protein
VSVCATTDGGSDVAVERELRKLAAIRAAPMARPVPTARKALRRLPNRAMRPSSPRRFLSESGELRQV